MGTINMKKTNTIPAMTPSVVHEYLYQLGTEWTGKGVAMELGSWLGATSAPLLRGLMKAGYDRPFWAFDRWWANEQQITKALKQGVTLTRGQNTMKLYLENVLPIYKNIVAVRSVIPGGLTSYSGDPIEILILDAPKRNPVFKGCMEYLLPHCIPGVTIIGLLDYHFWRQRTGEQRKALKAPVLFMEKYKDNFSFLQDWDTNICSCVFFKYEKQMSW